MKNQHREFMDDFHGEATNPLPGPVWNPTQTLDVYHWNCPPKSWEWLSAQVPPGNQVVRLIVGSRMHAEFSQRVHEETTGTIE